MAPLTLTLGHGLSVGAQEINLKPDISNIVVSQITDSGFTIAGDLNTHGRATSITLEWGTTPDSLLNLIEIGTYQNGPFQDAVAGMPYDTTIYYRLRAINQAGIQYKSGNTKTAKLAEFTQYMDRVLADSGIVRSESFTEQYTNFLKDQGRLANVKLLIAPEMGSKRRTSGVNTYVSKMYDAAKKVVGVEKITDVRDRDFSADTGWWTKTGESTISNGKVNIKSTAGAASDINRLNLLTIGRWYKLTYSVIANRGGTLGCDAVGSAALGQLPSTVGQQSLIFSALSTYFHFKRYSGITDIEIDNVSIQELNINDALQTTELKQPFLAGNIAPNSKYALHVPNGADRSVSIPTISFGPNDGWSVTIIANWNYTSAGTAVIMGNTGYLQNIYFDNAFSFNLFFHNLTGNISFQVGSSKKLIGKNCIIHFVANGNNTLKAYINGVEVPVNGVSTVDTSIVFEKILSGQSFGRFHGFLIQSGALSAAQVSAEASLLRGWIPEVENVTVGAQQWASSNLDIACTPQGNLINEVQINANTERVVNSGFDTDTWWGKTGNATISGGKATIVSPDGVILSYINTPPTILTIGKWYKFTYTIVANRAGSLAVTDFNAADIALSSAVGTYTIYVKARSTSFAIKRIGITDIDIDNVSCQEIGWAGSQELYDYIYTNTAGSVEQKTYAAVKSAAMWSYFNNDLALGAVYGKLYNWFAAKLLQMDIDYYNTANPTAPWDWRVPTELDYNNLSTFLGGASIAGKKLKLIGSTYWTVGNTGDNISGFSAIGAGRRRNDTGAFTQATSETLYHVVDTNNCFALTSSQDSLNRAAGLTGVGNNIGAYIRLIKA